MRARSRRALGICAIAGVLVAGCHSGTTGKRAAARVTTTTVIVATTAPVTTTTAPPSPTVVSCASSALRLSEGGWQGAGGTDVSALVFTNHGTAACTLQGFPGVSNVGANGVQIGPPAGRSTTGPGSTISLEPGQATSAYLMTLGGSSLNCTTPVRTIGLRVYPSGQTAALFLAADGETCPDAPVRAVTVYPVGQPPPPV